MNNISDYILAKDLVILLNSIKMINYRPGRSDRKIVVIEEHTMKLNKVAAVSLSLSAFLLAAANATNSHDNDRSQGKPDHEHGPQKYTIALFGDMPYNTLGKQQYPNL
jgi:hypothetical protein